MNRVQAKQEARERRLQAEEQARARFVTDSGCTGPVQHQVIVHYMLDDALHQKAFTGVEDASMQDGVLRLKSEKKEVILPLTNFLYAEVTWP